MNLTLLKNYAPAARKAFIEAVTRRAGVVGVYPDRVEPVTESGDVALIGGQPFPRSIVSLRKQLLEIIHRDGFAATMEAMAYTWFNRLVAIRFMELHDGWLSHGYRVLSHPDGHGLLRRIPKIGPVAKLCLWRTGCGLRPDPYQQNESQTQTTRPRIQSPCGARSAQGYQTHPPDRPGA